MKKQPMRMGFWALASFTVTVLDPLSSLAQQPDRLFFTDTKLGYVRGMNLDGSEVDRLLFRKYWKADSIRVDPLEAKLYWADSTFRTIFRGDLDGANIEPLVHLPDGYFHGFSLDTLRRKMYWSYSSLDAVFRASLDGSDQEEIISDQSLGSLAVDEIGGHIYYFEQQLDRLRRANLDGTQVVDLVQTTDTTVVALVLDIPNGKMYWTDHFLGAIRIANLDGSGISSLPIANIRPGDMTLFDNKLYWSLGTEQVIQRANLNGTQVENLVATATRPYSIAVNPFTQHLLWGEVFTLFQAELDGQNPIPLIEPNFYSPFQMDVDPIRRQIYWATSNGQIQHGLFRANYDGSGFEVWPGPTQNPTTLVIDANAGHLYWFDFGGRLFRANLDGSDVIWLNPATVNRARDAALDFAGKLYWTEANAIKRANLDGSDLETILPVNAQGVEIDPSAGKLYWAGGIIGRANLDGSDTETLVPIISGNSPYYLALNPERDRMYWTSVLGIEYSTLDGSQQGILYLSDLPYACRGIALEATGADLYWAAAWRNPDRTSCLGTNITVLPMIGFVDNGLSCP